MRWLTLMLVCACRLVTREVAEREECTANTNCERGKVCYFARCVDGGPTPVAPLYVVIAPNATQPYFPQQQMVEVKDGRINLRWTTTSILRGRGTNAGNPLVGATLRLIRSGVIPGISMQIEQPLDGRGFYELNVEPGMYQATLRPRQDAEARFDPPWVIGSNEDRVIDVQYPSQQLRVAGALLASPSETSGRSDAVVYAVADNTGLQSSVALSGPDGSYELSFTGAPTGVTLFVRPGPQNPFLPEIARHFSLPAPAGFSPVYIPDIGSTAAPSGHVEASYNQVSCGIFGAVISAETNVGGGVYRTSVVTDQSGNFILPIIRATLSTVLTYRVTVDPPFLDTPCIKEQFGRIETTFQFAASSEPPALVFKPPVRPRLTGTVHDVSGVPLRGVGVRPTDISSVEVYTDANGLYQLRLDPGTYEITFEPPVGAELARTSATAHITADAQELHVQLPRPAILAGEIDAPVGLSLEDARLTFYTLIDGRPVVIGDARVNSLGAQSPSGDRGHFSVALPAAEAR